MDLNGRVKEIYVGGEREGPMRSVLTAEAIAGKGLLGDRYALGTGSYSNSKGIRDVTLIEIESLWNLYRTSGIDVHPGLTRRNIVTEGIELSKLIGTQFSIGSVSFLGLRSCPPCRHLAKLVGIQEILAGLSRSGGIYAQVLNDGSFSLDDLLIQCSESIP